MVWVALPLCLALMIVVLVLVSLCGVVSRLLISCGGCWLGLAGVTVCLLWCWCFTCCWAGWLGLLCWLSCWLVGCLLFTCGLFCGYCGCGALSVFGLWLAVCVVSCAVACCLLVV